MRHAFGEPTHKEVSLDRSIHPSYDELHFLYMAKKAAKTILIAEDDAGIIDVMKIILEQESYRVVTARNKVEVQTMLQQILPSLIFLDIRLGGENGAEVAQALRADERTAAIPLIIVSGDSQTATIARQVHASEYLVKPFELDVLLMLVKKYIK